jgi:hypothetical protein
MRLSDRERKAIVRAVHRYDAQALVFLFGSRADDAKKGGAVFEQTLDATPELFDLAEKTEGYCKRFAGA